MTKFKSLLLETNKKNIKDILDEGLKRTVRNTHLVGDQIRNNKDQFLENLNAEKFVSVFGTPIGILGVGVFGVVYDLPKNKALKVTFDYYEAPFLHKLSKNPKEGLVNVDKVVSFSFGSSQAYGILRDELTPITQTNYYSEAREVLSDMKRGRRNKNYTSKKKEEIKEALQAMYDIDPDWDGTHIENLGIQNGNVVLYDGFSKNIDVSKDSIPNVKLSN